MHNLDYYRLIRQVSRRRRDLLRAETGRDLIYPDINTAWIPSNREAALCDSFIVLFVAELETYLEFVVETALAAFEDRFRASGLQNCGASKDYCTKIIDKRKQWSKNNNANWSRLEEFFTFIGLKKSTFPDDMWDDIEVIVKHRGDVVHNSAGVRTLNDPRITISKVESCLKKIKLFDRDYYFWRKNWLCDIEKLRSSSFNFTPGIGTIGLSL